MKRKLTVITLVAAALTLGISPAQTAPKPKQTPVSWELEIYVANPPQPITLKLPGATKPRTFWFMRYRVSNRTGADRIFVPDFVLYTDTGQVVRAGRRVPPSVFKKIQKVYGDVLLRPVSGMTGKLLQGEDNSKAGVAIFHDFDPKAGSFDVFVGGLSGETREVKLPKAVQATEIDLKTGKEVKVMRDKIVLAKTLKLTYTSAASGQARRRKPAKLKSKSWVMR